MENRWYEPRALYFRVRTTDGERFILKYQERDDEWTLQGGFDGDELLGRPGTEVVAVSADLIRKAEKLVESCEHCHDDAEIPFDWILDRVIGRDETAVDYIMTGTARCPTRKHEITEKTLIGD